MREKTLIWLNYNLKMPPSFLSYIVRQHGLTFEDVATDALAHVLQNSSTAGRALRDYFNRRVADILPAYFSLETRLDTQEFGIPDLVLKGEAGMPCVIIEAKFTARLTPHQPGSYLQYLGNQRLDGRSAMLVFLVPESKIVHYEKEIRARCVASGQEVCWDTSESTKPSLFIHLMTWTQILRVLRSAEPTTGEFGIFLQDLERMCQVAEPDKYEELTDAELVRLAERNNGLAVRMRNFMDLAGEIARRSFSGTQKISGKYDDAWGATWSGIYGMIADFEAWIGVDASAWSDHGLSPIWLQLTEWKRLPEIEVHLITLGRDKGYFLNSNGSHIAVPIFVGPGSRDEVLGRCCDQITALSHLLTDSPSMIEGAVAHPA